MKLAMAQMAMSADMAENLKNSLRFCEEANGSDLLFFPEIQLCPFFPQYERLVCCEIDLAESDAWRAKKPYIPTRRPECYQ